MPEVVISKPVSPKLTRFQFINRFTFEEMVAIEEAASKDTEVRVVLRMLELAEEIDIQNDRLRAGIDLLVSKGLLTRERFDEILSE